jgi:hypothetical protein
MLLNLSAASTLLSLLAPAGLPLVPLPQQGAAALSGGVIPVQRGREPGAEPLPLLGSLAVRCADSIVDKATGLCIEASSVGTLGLLHPLSEDFFVHPNGRVGIGTTDPAARLHVEAAGYGEVVQLPGLRLFWLPAGVNVLGGIGHEVDSSTYGVSIGGGAGHRVRDSYASVGGGFQHEVTHPFGTIAGGLSNRVSGNAGTVSGGWGNLATGPYAAIPGGRENRAEGSSSLAAGFRATAAHDHCFVWADSSTSEFASTAANQFLIQASGGVGIGTNAPAADLHLRTPSGLLRVDAATNPMGATLELRGNVGSAYHGSLRFRSSAGNPGPEIRGWTLGDIEFRTAETERMRIAQNGAVGIGVIAPPGVLLAVNGNAAKPGGGSWAVLSDARLKRDLRPIDGALEQMLGLQGRRFSYADPERFGWLPGEQTGFVAQEVEEVFPSWVSEDEEGIKSVSVIGFEALAVEALRELRAEKDAEIAALKAAQEALCAEIDELRQLVLQLGTGGGASLGR